MKTRKECEILPAVTLIKQCTKIRRKRLSHFYELSLIYLALLRRQIDRTSRDALNLKNCKSTVHYISNFCFFLMLDTTVFFLPILNYLLKCIGLHPFVTRTTNIWDYNDFFWSKNLFCLIKYEAARNFVMEVTKRLSCEWSTC